MSVFSHSISYSCFNSLPHMLSFFCISQSIKIVHLFILQCVIIYFLLFAFAVTCSLICFFSLGFFARMFRFLPPAYLRLFGLPRYFMIVYILYHSHFPLTHTQIHCSPPFHPHPHSIILLFSFPFSLFYFTSLRSLLRECKFFFFEKD